MSTEERHSFLIGLFEVLCPWPARYRITQDSEYKPFREHHYYLGGRASGCIILMLLLTTMAILAKKLL